MNLTQLRDLAKSLKLIRTSGLKKAELQELIDLRQADRNIPPKHMHPGVIFKKLLSLPSWEWCVEELQVLSGKYLQALSIVMGIPKSGTKAKILERLQTTAEVRFALSDFKHVPQDVTLESAANATFVTGDPEVLRLASTYKGEFLKALCRKVKCFAGSTKYAMAAALLQWKNQSAHIGVDAYKAVLASLKA